MSRQLHEVIAIEKGVRNRCQEELTKLYHTVQKPELFEGETKTYTPKAEDGEKFPDANVKVQAEIDEIFARILHLEAEQIDIEATKEYTNTLAKADIIIDGKTVVSDVPATTLLFLEKRLVDVRTFIQKLPTLNPAYDWEKVKDSSLHKTDPVESTKSRKIEKYEVIVPPTKEHPAQTVKQTTDEIIGTWTSVKLSSAISPKRKIELWQQINALIDGIKAARERANSTDAVEQKIGKDLFNFIFAEKAVQTVQ